MRQVANGAHEYTRIALHYAISGTQEARAQCRGGNASSPGGLPLQRVGCAAVNEPTCRTKYPTLWCVGRQNACAGIKPGGYMLCGHTFELPTPPTTSRCTGDARRNQLNTNMPTSRYYLIRVGLCPPTEENGRMHLIGRRQSSAIIKCKAYANGSSTVCTLNGVVVVLFIMREPIVNRVLCAFGLVKCLMRSWHIKQHTPHATQAACRVL